MQSDNVMKCLELWLTPTYIQLNFERDLCKEGLCSLVKMEEAICSYITLHLKLFSYVSCDFFLLVYLQYTVIHLPTSKQKLQLE